MFFKDGELSKLSFDSEKDQKIIYDYFIVKGKFNLATKSNNKIIKEINKGKYAKDRKFILSTADNIAKNKIIFNDKWDMEQTQEHYDYEGEIDWINSQNKDDEYVFMLNRHNIWYLMAKAYFISKDEKYVKAIIKQFYSWTKQDYPNNGIESYVNRCLDKGIRMINWIKMIKLIKESVLFTASVFCDMLKQINLHIADMQNNYPDYHKLSNHGTIRNQAMVMLQYYFLELSIWGEPKHLIKKIEDNAELQILPDGIHWEQTPMYQCWVVISFLEIKKYCDLLSFKLSKEYMDKVKKLAIGLIKFIKPNRHQPMQNDGDDTNIFDILIRAAIELKDGRFKYIYKGKWNIELLLDYGLKGLLKFEKLKPIDPGFKSIACVESGNYYLRNSWSKNANYLNFRNGQFGNGHGHAEQSHFSIFANGEEWITSTGRFTYIDSKDRILFKEAKMHNTVLINNKGSTIPNSAWGFKDISMPIKSIHKIGQNIDFISGWNLGYMYNQKPTIPNRKIIFVKPNYWIMFDNFYTKYENKYTFLYHVLQNTMIDIKKNKIILQKNNKVFNIHNLDEISYLIKPGVVSKHYNLKEASQVLEGKVVEKGDYSFMHIFESGDDIKKISPLSIYKNDGKIASKGEVRGWKVSYEDKNNYDLVLHALTENKRGKKGYIINNICIYAKTAVITCRNNKMTKHILEY